MPSLTICVFGCATEKKYADQIRSIQRTWGKRARDFGVRCLIFCGEKRGPEDLYNDGWNNDIVHLEGVGDDYGSASPKQWLGLKWIHENVPTDFVHVCGTDTFVVIHNVVRFLEEMDPAQPLYIGGHGDFRKVNGEPTYFHSGGPGFILSRTALARIAPDLDQMQSCYLAALLHDERYLEHACDVAMGWYARRYNMITIVSNGGFFHCNHLGYPCHMYNGITIVSNGGFFHCNHLGYPCHMYNGILRLRTILACHLMSESDMEEAHQYTLGLV